MENTTLTPEQLAEMTAQIMMERLGITADDTVPPIADDITPPPAQDDEVDETEGMTEAELAIYNKARFKYRAETVAFKAKHAGLDEDSSNMVMRLMQSGATDEELDKYIGKLKPAVKPSGTKVLGTSGASFWVNQTKKPQTSDYDIGKALAETYGVKIKR